MKRTSKSHKRSTKLLAMVLSVLMILGAMPIMAFALEKAPVTEWPTIDGPAEIYVGQKYSTLKLVGGKCDIPGEFGWSTPDASTTIVGTRNVYMAFYPEDTATYSKTTNRTSITVKKSEAAKVEGTVYATVPKGKTLADATITKFADFKVRSYDTTYNTAITWANPDKVMDTIGRFEENATVAAANSSGTAYTTDKLNTIDMPITVNVVNEEDMTVVQELPVASELYETQTLADSTLTGGVVTKGGTPVPGTFTWKDSSIVMNKYGTEKYDVVFTPTDPAACEPVYMLVSVTTNFLMKVTEKPTASDITIGQKLADSVLTGGVVTKMGEPVPGTFAWERPETVPPVGHKSYSVVFTPTDPAACEPVKTTVYLNINNIVEIAELPKASDIVEGQTLADSTLTGGSVTKYGAPVLGTFSWKDPTVAPAYGSSKQTVIFTPDDSAACDPQEISVYINTNAKPVEITEWPKLTCQYLLGEYYRQCVVLEGGTASVEGKFSVKYDNYNAKIPTDTKITDTFEMKIEFKPTNSRYGTVYETVTGTFVPGDPDCFISSSNYGSKETGCGGALRYKGNWSQHTGKFWYILDGERIEITEPSFSYKYTCDDLAPGAHTAYCEYVPGENDVYAYSKSTTTNFNIIAYYDLIVNDAAGTRVVGNYKAGARVNVGASVHENPYYEFTEWTVEGTPLPEDLDLTQVYLYFNMPDGEVELTANYKFNVKRYLQDTFLNIIAKLAKAFSSFIESLAPVFQAFAPIIEFIRNLIPQK